jgi:putative peptide zinc metalloprotease protein
VCRRRCRRHLAGMALDVLLAAAMLLCVAYLSLPHPIGAWLRAFILSLLLSVLLQAQVHMRTDLYFTLRDLLRCRNLFEDGPHTSVAGTGHCDIR